jgi:peptidoglycan/LPS O-acetylase OafA/YrhL
VLLGHMAGTAHAPAFLSYLDGFAQLGVTVFFVISGYLITTLLIKEREKTGTISLKNFYIRRGARILPAAYVFTTVAVIWFWRDLQALEITAAYLYFHNFVYGSWALAHLWSLSIEEQFYLVWPAIFALGSGPSKKIALWVIALSPFIRIACYFLGYIRLSRYSFTVADTLATGCLLAMMAPILKRYDRLLLTPTAGLVSATVVVGTHVASFWHPLTKYYNSFGVTLVQIAIAMLIYNAVHLKYSFLNWKPLASVGVLSYSLYLWQQLFLNKYDVPTWYTSFPQNIFFAFAAASASYFVIEKPMLRLRERLQQRNDKPLSAPFAAAASAD